MFNDVELKQMFDNGDFDDPHYGRPKWEDVVDVNNQQPRSSGFDYEKSEREYQQTGRSFSYEYGKDGKPIKKDDSPPGKKASTKSGGFSYEYGPDGQPKANSADEGQENKPEHSDETGDEQDEHLQLYDEGRMDELSESLSNSALAAGMPEQSVEFMQNYLNNIAQPNDPLCRDIISVVAKHIQQARSA